MKIRTKVAIFLIAGFLKSESFPNHTVNLVFSLLSQVRVGGGWAVLLVCDMPGFDTASGAATIKVNTSLYTVVLSFFFATALQ